MASTLDPSGILPGLPQDELALRVRKALTAAKADVDALTSLRNYASDAAAAAGGVPVGGLYHNAGAVRVRLT